jgi:hypothetical protein
MNKEQKENKYNELLNISSNLMDMYNYFDDEDCKLHYDDFMHFIVEDLDKMMETLKDRYYELYTHRRHQRC